MTALTQISPIWRDETFVSHQKREMFSGNYLELIKAEVVADILLVIASLKKAVKMMSERDKKNAILKLFLMRRNNIFAG